MAHERATQLIATLTEASRLHAKVQDTIAHLTRTQAHMDLLKAQLEAVRDVSQYLVEQLSADKEPNGD